MFERNNYLRLVGDDFRLALMNAGIDRAAKASALVEQKMKQRPTGKVDVDECKRVGKLVQKWLTHKGHFINFQRASLPTLRDLLGERVVRRLLGDQERGPVPDLAASLRQLLSNADEELHVRPALLFERKHDQLRKRMVAELSDFSTPGHHETLLALQASVDRFSLAGISAAVVLEPFIRQIPTNLFAEDFDIVWLCAVARFANNLRQILDRRLLSIEQLARFQECSHVFGFAFSLLERWCESNTRGGQHLVIAQHELMSHKVLSVQIAGLSPFNLSRFSATFPLVEENRFRRRLSEAIELARAIERQPRVPYISVQQQEELSISHTSILYRGLVYSKNPQLRPSQEKVERVTDQMRSTHKLAKRSSLQLRFYVATGELKRARKLCDDIRLSLARAPENAFPSLLDPIYTINSYRFGGSASSREYRSAVEQLRDEPIAYSLYGHHLISTGKDTPIDVG